MRERPGDRHPLLLAAGELRRVGVLLLAQPDPLRASRRAVSVASAFGAPAAPVRWRDRQVAEHGEVGEEVELLEHHPDARADVVEVAVGVGDVLALDDDRARRWAPPGG